MLGGERRSGGVEWFAQGYSTGQKQMWQHSPNLYNTYPVVMFLDCRWRCWPLPVEHTPLFDTILYYLCIYFSTISSCFVPDQETTQGQQKNQLDLCHNHPYARQMQDSTILRPKHLAFYRAWVPAFSVSFTREMMSCPVSWSKLSDSGSAVHCDSEVSTWNFIHRVNTKFVVRWVLTCDNRKSVRALKEKKKSRERGNRAPGKTDAAQKKLRRWLTGVPGVPLST